MHNPIIDKRSINDIKDQIKILAKQYVPEWKYDFNDPDVGAVFSEIFASMFENTITMFNKTPYNYYITFLNMLGAKLLPPISSTGMITVDLVPETKGIFINKGTSVYASADNEEGRVYYETIESMFAIDLNIDSIFVTNAKNDSISKIYDIKTEEKLLPFKIFDDNEFKNLQSHEIYFEDSSIFEINSKSNIIFKFHDVKSLKNDKHLNDIFSDDKNIVWQYYNDLTWKTINNVERIDDGIKLVVEDEIDKKKQFGKESNFIRCILKKIPDDEIKLTGVSYLAQSSNLEPDALLSGMTELANTDFFPFGEQYSIYTDFYISSREAFVKKGSNITINIDMKFVKVKLDIVEFKDTTNYRYVMSEIDFKEQKESDIEIEKVSWEYWNGKGWARLYSNNDNEDFFLFKDDEEKKSIKFVCPSDMELITLGPQESCFIRARILKVKNQFSNLGSYITPCINKISIDYEYVNRSINCKNIYVKSNVEDRLIKFKGDTIITLLKKSLCDHPTMYFCLDNPIFHGPVKILFDIEPGMYRNLPSLRWEYYSKDSQGNFKWNNLDILDSTENLSNSSIVSIIGKSDFEKTKIFGREGYFIRIVNHDNEYYKELKSVPVINGIYINTVQVSQSETRIPEYFSIDNMQANKVCKLSCDNILSVEVWVNEFGSLSDLEEEIIRSNEGSYIIEYNDEGRISEFWVKWEPKSNIAAASLNERVYEINYNKGTITFGNGKHGKIPTSQDQQSIKVEYSISSGRLGNIGAEEIQGFSDAIPYVSSVKNIKQFVGGVDMEDVSAVARRMSSKLSGMNRIVSLDDFELAIRCNDRNIYKVKCMPHVDNLSKSSVGMISIAVLPKDYMQGYEKFLIIKDRIRDFIKSAAPITLSEASKINIFEVMYVEVAVKVNLVIDDYNYYQELYQNIYNKLEIFLDPITGNFDQKGWEIGSFPRKESIYNFIKLTKNIKLIKSVDIFTKAVTLEGKKDIDLETINNQYFVVPVFGEPEINIMVN